MYSTFTVWMVPLSASTKTQIVSFSFISDCYKAVTLKTSSQNVKDISFSVDILAYY